MNDSPPTLEYARPDLAPVREYFDGGKIAVSLSLILGVAAIVGMFYFTIIWFAFRKFSVAG